AVALALASDEQATGGEYTPPWGRRQVHYLERLTAEAGYQPSEWEQAQLAGARERVRARDELSCPRCGCRYDQHHETYGGCDVDRAGDGSWQFRCTCPAPAPAGMDADDVYDALEDLVAVIDTAGAITARLPAAAQDAIEEPFEAFSELWADQAGDGPTGP